MRRLSPGVPPGILLALLEMGLDRWLLGMYRQRQMGLAGGELLHGEHIWELPVMDGNLWTH